MDSLDFKIVRVKLGLSQTEMAQELGLCRASIQNYENGKRNIPIPVKIAAMAILEKSGTGGYDSEGVDSHSSRNA